MNTKLRAALATLPLLERAVLVRRYGLDGRHQRTYAEIASELDMTPSKAREIEARGLLRAQRSHRP